MWAESKFYYFDVYDIVIFLISLCCESYENCKLTVWLMHISNIRVFVVCKWSLHSTEITFLKLLLCNIWWNIPFVSGMFPPHLVNSGKYPNYLGFPSNGLAGDIGMTLLSVHPFLCLSVHPSISLSSTFWDFCAFSDKWLAEFTSNLVDASIM